MYVSSIGPSSERNDEGPMLETLDYTIRIGSTPTFLYFDLYGVAVRPSPKNFHETHDTAILMRWPNRLPCQHVF